MSNFKTTLTILFGACIVIANITAAKLAFFNIPVLGGVAVPAGFIAFGVAFLCSDLLVEFEGEAYAHKVVNSTVVALLVAYGLILIAIALPTAPFYNGQEAYAQTLGQSSAIVIASVITILLSQHIDVKIFAFIKAATHGRKKYLRNIGSTTISQLLDTIIFISLAFAIIPTIQGTQATWGSALLSIILGQYIVKVVVALLDTPVFYLITALRE